MGGTGGDRGYFVGESSIESLRERAASVTWSAQVESHVNQFLQSLLSHINDRDAERVSEYLDEIFQSIRADIEGMDSLLYGGSVAKHTYVDGLSDVDALVVFRSEPGAPPGEVRSALFDILRAKLPTGEVAGIQQGQMAVTVTYGDGIEIQLLPAVRGADGSLKISSSDGLSWSPIAPRRFAERLTATNRDNGGVVVPVIKLAKSLLSSLPEERRLTGYHVEALAVDAFRGADNPRNLREGLIHFFAKAKDRVRAPLTDVTGQSTHVDGYLGDEGSLHRRIASDALSRMYRRLANAHSLEQWRDFFEPT